MEVDELSSTKLSGIENIALLWSLFYLSRSSSGVTYGLQGSRFVGPCNVLCKISVQFKSIDMLKGSIGSLGQNRPYMCALSTTPLERGHFEGEARCA